MKKKVRNKGYALLSIMVIGLFAMTFLMSLAGILTSVARSEGVQRQKNILTNAADGAVDYIVNEMNTNASAFSGGGPFDLPILYLPDALTTVKFNLRTLTPAEWTQVKDISGVYSSQLVPSGAAAPLPESLIKKDYWKVAEITAKRGVFEKNVRVIIQPQLILPPGMQGSGSGSSSSSSLFTQPLFANGQFEINSPSTISKITSDTTGPDVTIQSNSSAKLASGSTINGNLTITNSGSPSSDVVTITAPGSPTNVSGTTTANGTIDDGLTTTAVENQSAPQGTLAPVPTSDASSSALPDNSPDGSSSPIDLSSGSFVTSSLSGTAGDRGYNSTDTTNPTKIYIEGPSQDATAVDINSNLLPSVGDSTNLQIYYAGTKNVNLHLTSDFSGLIYAPNATVTIDGANIFNGALVGKVVNIANPTVNLKTSISNSGTSGYSGVQYLMSTDGTGVIFQGFQPITWQEVSERLVP